MKHRIFAIVLLALAAGAAAQNGKDPARIGIVGLVHSHVHGFLPRALSDTNVQIVGIVEPDQELVAKAADRYHLPRQVFFPSLEQLLARTNVQAVATFTSTFDHKRVVETCALRGVQVMMEKPLAVNMRHANAIQAAARKGGIQVLVNYETTWYSGNHEAYRRVREGTLGELRKIVVYDGHPGPKEIGCPPEFLEWLTDPKLNGGGALADFGCYGADLITWLMNGQRPTSVLAVTQQFKPKVYPKVEDEATVIVTYPKTQGIIQASWNWPYNRKDMEVYGEKGYVTVPKNNIIRFAKGGDSEDETTAPPLLGPNKDPISYLAAVARGEVKPSDDLSSLKVNMIVMEILDAARESARTGKRIDLKP
jgi:predicted dehydrogenase